MEFMAQNAEATGRIAKALGGLGGGETLDEEGAQGLVLPMDGVLGVEKDGAEIR